MIRFGVPFLALVLLTCSACSGSGAVAAGQVVTAVDSTEHATRPAISVPVPAPRALSRVVVSNPSPPQAHAAGTGSAASTAGAAPTKAVTSPPASVSRTIHPTPSGAVQAGAVVDVPGPDKGPACSVARQYSDEPSTGLRPDVKAAWISAKRRAAGRGVTLCLNDGKRSRAQQIGLLRSYVEQYGSATAHDLVLPWQKSAHVKGYAVDVQPASAYQWLEATKGSLGFCRIYDNEAWHFEYSLAYRTAGCPARQTQPAG
jgi:D-alanyl-D-alanine carboxypeptidase